MTDIPVSAAPEPEALNPKAFVFERELSEVHLLLDNLSSTEDEVLQKVPDGTLLPPNWLERVCAISWPPTGSTADQAADAALLIRTKDFLNSQVKPANGSTIAFTLLVTQSASLSWPSKLLRWEAPRPHTNIRSLAATAYPGLITRANTFRLGMVTISAFLCVFLLFTCALSWYASFGTVTLAERSVLRATYADALKRVKDAEAAPATPPAIANKSAPDQTTAQTPAETSDTRQPTAAIPLCERLLPVDPKNPDGNKGHDSIQDMQVCDAKDQAAAALVSIDNTIWRWLSFLNLEKGLFSPGKGDNTALYAGSMTGLLATSILPVMYGVLGAAAAVVRIMSAKIRQSLLAPRDLHLSLQQIALGAVMGACIGLFVSQQSANAQITSSFAAAASLSSSALSFVAGFGVDSVFAALEVIISRVFLSAPSQSK